jgi:alpha-mannosidase
MALNQEWKHRIERWQTAIWASCYQPLGDISLDGFVTKEYLTAFQAMQESFSPMPPGTRWGAKWEYGWFKGSFILPEVAAGKRIVVQMKAGGESLVWINGVITGSIGWAHKEITVAMDGKSGEQYNVLLEAYAGHGKISVGEGPQRYGTEWMPEPGSTQATVERSTFGIWHEDVYQLAVDFTTLLELRDHLDAETLRVADIDQALMDATLIYDPELPPAEMVATAQEARAHLKPVLDCTNGSTMPVLHAFGHAHIDIAWLWPWQETERKIARTVANQLSLFDEYPEYKFLQSQPHLYVMLRQRYPELYERVKVAIKAGKFIPDGAMWVEADTNLAGGEALIRQVVLGRKFFRDEFDIDSRVLWLPDVFGYSGALPQILKGCGCSGFATQKITWAYNGGEPFPYTTFWWEGIDGSAIPAHIYYDYNSHTRPNAIFARWNDRLQKNGIRSIILAYGWGDGGGGPTRDHIEYLRRSRDLEGLPRVQDSSPAAFFVDVKAQGLPKERYVGELYFQAHRGTYTSQAKTKQGNRRSEFALREAELWSIGANAIKGYVFTSKSLADAWQDLLLCQFHDVLPGSSIKRVYDEAEETLARVIVTANKAALAAAATFVDIPPGFNPAVETATSAWGQRWAYAGQMTVFNSLNWERTALVETPSGVVDVTVPACGWKTFPLGASEKGKGSVTATARSLENEMLRVEFNERGEVTSVYDKQARREVMAAPGNQLRLYKDVPDNWDAWDLDTMYELQPVETNAPVMLEVLASGPVVAKLKLSRKLHHSALTQIISLSRGSRRVEFTTTIDWQESHKLLKVAFPVNIHANEAIHEIQFGHLRRPNHRSRPFDQDRFEVCNHKWTALAEENRGVAVLNDCKYGVNVLGNSINLTLLKSGLAPDPMADRGVQTFTYALYPWTGSFAESNVVRESYELNAPVMVVPGAGGEGSLFSMNAPNIILEAVKLAEDGSGDVIVRLYEAKHMATGCTMVMGLPVKAASETDMMEENASPLSCAYGKVPLEFRPFEVKTVRLQIAH